jgi:hypothetical protein
MPQATMTIVVQDDGSVEVNGPLDNALLFHGMLGVAADILRSYTASKTHDRPRVSLAPPGTILPVIK